jgi:hypothetical protein
MSLDGASEGIHRATYEGRRRRCEAETRMRMTTSRYLARGFLLMAACLGAFGLAVVWLGPYGLAIGISALAVALAITAIALPVFRHTRSS